MFVQTAAAGLTPDAINSVFATPKPGAQLALGLAFTDQTGTRVTLSDAIGGRPAVLVLVDYTCRGICGPVLAFVAQALTQSGLDPRSDYRLLAVGLDPKDTAADAQSMQRAQLADDALAASRFLIADDRAIEMLTSAAGYGYVYDRENDQFAHPAVALVLTPDGRIARALDGLSVQARDLRLALVEAGRGKLGTWRDQLRLLCYGFDPAAGVYTPAVHRVLMIAAGATALLLAAGIAWLLLAERRAAA
jgi:protein SCO1